ncbi:ubiquitin-activating enzyme E1 1-like protein isoform X2, partial [Tanacetum coccineum]
FQKKLEDTRSFVVGSGALGCEFLKNLALMGVSCGTQGKLTVTDDDVIEKSNLSRQFLFRDWNIGQAKSTVAASAVALINPRLQIEALQNRVGPETENVFDDTFWENLNVVVNALDNVNARLYVDQRCLYFQKPLLESGTLGAKCNTQMVIPHLTENYGASRDPPEKQAPMCTVHSFPHNIDHCLTWARSEFEGLLEKTPAEVNAYLSNPGEYTSSMIKAGDAQARDNLERVLECLDRERCETFQDCITWARLKFEDYFVNRMKQLIFTFPEDAATSTGAPFWSAPKRFPRPLEFSVSDLTHLNFVLAGSILRAETFGIPIPDWAKNPKKLAEAIDQVIVPDFQPKQGVKIETDENVTNLSSASIDDSAVIDELIKKLESRRKNLPSGYVMKPIQFEKDDDTNYHMEFIAGLANMRARNYSIPEVDKLRAKFIAGRIIPAIATSTAMATGLVCLELYKVIDGGHKVEDYRNTFANLALPLFSMAEPVPPKVIKHQDLSWTVWDRWTIKGNPTLRELIKWLADKGLDAYSISCGSCLLFNSMFPRHKERMDKKVVDLARDVAKMEIPAYRRHLDLMVACEDEEENDIDIPQVNCDTESDSQKRYAWFFRLMAFKLFHSDLYFSLYEGRALDFLKLIMVLDFRLGVKIGYLELPSLCTLKAPGMVSWFSWGSFKIIVKGKVFQIRAKELFVWSPSFKEVPEVVHCSDDESVKNEADINVVDNILLSLQETKKESFSDLEVKYFWGNYQFDHIEDSIIFISAPMLLIHTASKCQLWDFIASLINQWNGECMVMGDFNEVRCKEDRWGSTFLAQGACSFNSFISNAGLNEVSDLEASISDEEIRKAVWGCGENKSPGPDGFTFEFFRKFWTVVGPDFCIAVKWFFEHGFFATGCNSSFVTLIPKTLDPKLTTFLPNRQILDGPFIINEILARCKHKNQQAMFFKVDFAKAYDSIRWDYLDDVLNAFGFGSRKAVLDSKPQRLLKIVLGSTPIYNMSIFKVPKTVLNKMENLRRNFFNGIQEGDRKITWVKWHTVLATKKFGGLGVSSFFALNRGLLAKWVWRFLSQDNSLWCQLISAIHGSSITDLSTAYPSTWNSIIKEFNYLKVQGVDVFFPFKLRIGNLLHTVRILEGSLDR